MLIAKFKKLGDYGNFLQMFVLSYDKYLQSTKIYGSTELRITLLRQSTRFHKITTFAKVIFARNIEVTEPVRIPL